jgi:hypothetical protein
MRRQTEQVASESESAVENGRALRVACAAVALEVAAVMDQRVATVKAMGASEERIGAVQALADAERRIAAEWDAPAERTEA